MIIKEIVVNTTNNVLKLIQYFLFGTLFLITLYVLLMRLTTGSFSTAVDQFNYYKIWILSLSVGFGIQLALYKLIKIKHIDNPNSEKIAKVTGSTSAVTMVACCAHHAVDVLPILGISALASFLGAYTKELFAIGIVFNLLGIGYMTMQLRRLNHAKI